LYRVNKLKKIKLKVNKKYLSSTNNQNKIYVPLALLLPLGLVWFVTQVQFWLGAVIANPVGIIMAIGVGIWLISKTQFSKKLLEISFWVFYLILLIGGSAFIGLLVSCANGDCI
jgi:hypothetical protein